MRLEYSTSPVARQVNKGLFFMLNVVSVLAVTGRFLRDLPSAVFADGGKYAPATPHIPGRGGHHRHRPHAPSDGRWHMKFHRSRV